jgi:hypothetical protein
MPTPTTYNYTISTAFPNGKVATDRLTVEIRASSIVTALDSISTSTASNNCAILFKDVLSGGDQTTLNAVVAAHQGVPLGGADAFQQFSVGVPSTSVSSYGRVQGYVGTSATSGKAIRATAYAPQGANAQRSVNSTSANDTSAGTGARTVTINYLTAAFVLKSETVTMNGTAAVNTVATDIAYIESIVVASVGSVGGNVGTIQVWTATAAGGSVWGSIAASDNQTFWAHHYVPSGLTCCIISFSAGATVVSGQANLNRSGDPSNANLPQLQIGQTVVHVAAGQLDHSFQVWLQVPGPDLIWIVERPVAATASTAVGGFEYVQF